MVTVYEVFPEARDIIGRQKLPPLGINLYERNTKETGFRIRAFAQDLSLELKPVFGMEVGVMKFKSTPMSRSVEFQMRVYEALDPEAERFMKKLDKPTVEIQLKFQ